MAEKSSATQAKNYIVEQGDSLTLIARKIGPSSGMSEPALVNLIYELNKEVIGKDKDKIRPGQALRIPLGLQKEAMGETAEPQSTKIKVGSIIHLQSHLPQGGYLEARGAISEKPVITKWHDPHIRAFVATHTSKDRDKGSGSWKILSAAGKPEGQPLAHGDTIYLLNMRPNVGYLDTFEWVRNLEPFKQFTNMTIGVFTSDVPRRGEGVSGIWTVRLSESSGQSKAEIEDGATIYLENLYPGAGYLVAHGDVAQHELFSDYEGQQHFVFTTPRQRVDDPAYRWTMTLSDHQPEKVPSTFYAWHELDSKFVDAGAFKIELPHNQPILSLNISSANGGETLTGHANETIQISAAWDAAQQRYVVIASSDERVSLDWQVGGRVSELVFKRSDKQARRIDGTIKYLEEDAIKFKANQALALDWQQFFDSTLWQSRMVKIDVALQATGSALSALLSSPEWQTPDEGERPFLKTQLGHIQQLQQSMAAFWQRFSAIAVTYIKHLNKKGLLSPVHLIKACLKEFTIDLEIVQRAIEQRRSVQAENSDSNGNDQANSLIVTDKLATMALTPFQHLITESSDVIPITYFSQAIHIRRLPYVDNFVLVGLSYDLSIDSSPQEAFPFELMAIPHEVGHFIYHHGKLQKDSRYAYETLADVYSSEAFMNHPYHHWFEEIFADLYGCMVAGPLTALGLLALLATGDRERLLLDDEEHPTPILRPFFLSEMLRILSEKSGRWQAGQKAYDFSDVAKSLDANWTTMLERWGFVTEGVVDGRPARIQIPSQTQGHWEGFINVETAVSQVRIIIQEFVDLLNHTYQNREKKPLQPWCKAWGTLDDYVAEIKELPRSKRLADKKPVTLDSKRSGQRERTGKKRVPVLPETDGEFSVAALQTILNGWEDSGPSGGSGGTHFH